MRERKDRFMFSVDAMCDEAIRLLDSYCLALRAFHRVRDPFLHGLQPGDPEWVNCILKRDAAFRKLVAARKRYLSHLECHCCRDELTITAA